VEFCKLWDSGSGAGGGVGMVHAGTAASSPGYGGQSACVVLHLVDTGVPYVWDDTRYAIRTCLPFGPRDICDPDDPWQNRVLCSVCFLGRPVHLCFATLYRHSLSGELPVVLGVRLAGRIFCGQGGTSSPSNDFLWAVEPGLVYSVLPFPI